MQCLGAYFINTSTNSYHHIIKSIKFHNDLTLLTHDKALIFKDLNAYAAHESILYFFSGRIVASEELPFSFRARSLSMGQTCMPGAAVRRP